MVLQADMLMLAEYTKGKSVKLQKDNHGGYGSTDSTQQARRQVTGEKERSQALVSPASSAKLAP